MPTGFVTDDDDTNGAGCVIHIGVPRAAPARKTHGKKRKAAAAAAAAEAETATDEQQHAEQDLDVEDGNELHSASLAEAKVKASPLGRTT